METINYTNYCRDQIIDDLTFICIYACRHVCIYAAVMYVYIYI